MKWWYARSKQDVTPVTVQMALQWAGSLPVPAAIRVRPDGKFWRIVGYLPRGATELETALASLKARAA
jgi:hypothetical protein